MKIHTFGTEKEDLEQLLTKYNIKYKIITYKDKCTDFYDLKFEGNKEFISKACIIEVKDWKKEYYKYLDIEESAKPKAYIHYKNYMKWRVPLLKKSKPLKVKNLKNRYPIYVVSYKRYETPYTINILKQMNIDFKVCIKQEEHDNYLTILPEENILVMSKEYEQNENQLGNYNSIPQRNRCLEDSIENGFDKHWILDDNIRHFSYKNQQKNHMFNVSDFFFYIEHFVNNINEEVGIISPNYEQDTPGIQTGPSFTINTKNYSCLLIDNNIFMKYNIRWRKCYNEDVRLTLECLTNGVRTIGVNMFTIKKIITGKCKGGNQEAYKNFSKLGFQNKVDEIIDEYPRYIALTTKRHKDERPHHRFKNLKDFAHFKFVTFKEK